MIPEWVVQTAIVGLAVAILIGRRFMKERADDEFAGSWPLPKETCLNCRHIERERCPDCDTETFSGWEPME